MEFADVLTWQHVEELKQGDTLSFDDKTKYKDIELIVGTISIDEDSHAGKRTFSFYKEKKPRLTLSISSNGEYTWGPGWEYTDPIFKLSTKRLKKTNVSGGKRLLRRNKKSKKHKKSKKNKYRKRRTKKNYY